MSLQVTYINDVYTEPTQIWIDASGIIMPELNKEYTVRSVYIAKGIYHLLLNEIKNKEIVIDPKGTKIEPGFAYYRFTDVPDNVLEWETVDKIFKNQTNG